MIEKEYHTKLAGVTKENDSGMDIQYILERLAEHNSVIEQYDQYAVTLEHEKDNEYDKNAIKVKCLDYHIGYIKKDLAKRLAPLVDENRIEAEISDITGGEDGKSYGCNILIRELSAGEGVAKTILAMSPPATASAKSKKSAAPSYTGPEIREPTIFDRLVPPGSIREKLLPPLCGAATLALMLAVLFSAFG